MVSPLYPSGTRSVGALRTGVCCAPEPAAPAEPALWLHPDPSRSWSPAPHHHWETGLKVSQCREDSDPSAVPIQAGMYLLHFFHGINYWGLISISAGGAAGPVWHRLCCALGASVPGPAPVTMGQKVPRARGLDTSCSGTGPARSISHGTSSSFSLFFGYI